LSYRSESFDKGISATPFEDQKKTRMATVLCCLGDSEFDHGLAGILIFFRVFGLKPTRAFPFCFSSLPKPGKMNSPFFLTALKQGC